MRERIGRRAFLFGTLALSTRRLLAARHPHTVREWLAATAAARQAGVQACLATIREQDRAIHAWVDVKPQQPLGAGRLQGIPFGVKDILETKGLATEYVRPSTKVA